MSFSIIIILFFIAVIGIAAIAYFIAEAIIRHQETYHLHTAETAKTKLEKMENDLQQLQANLDAAKQALTIAKIKRDPNAIIIGYNDKPAKTRRNPHIEFSK
tara:strand:+ start:401 stop:706 length:306 start_codon:yes stop_codon:yes gene_type:complete